MPEQTDKQLSMPQAKGPVGSGNHVVRQGECLESIAFERGLFWETVWNDPRNADVKKLRKNPNSLLPGDNLFVPERQEKTESVADAKHHRFRRKGIPAVLKLVLLDEEKKPRANLPYVLEIDQNRIEGQTTSGGEVIQSIPPDAKTGRLILGDGEEEFVLDLRHLDPDDEATGLQGRLRNLGYDPGEIDGKIGPATQSAISQFQRDQGLDVTGEPDQKTLDKLKEVYGS